jgi:hypothetical protein
MTPRIGDKEKPELGSPIVLLDSYPQSLTHPHGKLGQNLLTTDVPDDSPV